MSELNRQDSLLGPYRVLDLTDDKGFLCGKILGDLGADVVKIEKPGGDPSRSIGPFLVMSLTRKRAFTGLPLTPANGALP